MKTTIISKLRLALMVLVTLVSSNVFANEIHNLYSSLYVTEYGRRYNADGVNSVFGEGYSKGIDGNDAVQIPNWDEDIFINRNGKALSIETRPNITENDTVNLSFKKLRNIEYEWQFDPINMGCQEAYALLIDNYLHTQTAISLQNQTSIKFKVTTDPLSSDLNRFIIVFKKNPCTLVKLLNLKGNTKGTSISLSWNVLNDDNEITYITERSTDSIHFSEISIVEGSSLSKNYSQEDKVTTLGRNYYRVHLKDSRGSEKFSNIVSVDVFPAGKGLVVYPNPLIGSNFNLRFPDLTAGTYVVSIINALGQVESTTSIKHTGGQQVYPIKLNNILVKGMHHVQIRNNTSILNTQLISL